MRSAYNIQTTYLTNDEKQILYEKITVDDQFMKAIDLLKEKILSDANKRGKCSTHLYQWLKQCSKCWKSI